VYTLQLLLTFRELHEKIEFLECICTYLSENSAAREQWRLLHNEIHQIFSADYFAIEIIRSKVDNYPRAQGEVQLKCAGKALHSGLGTVMTLWTLSLWIKNKGKYRFVWGAYQMIWGRNCLDQALSVAGLGHLRLQVE